MRSISAKIAANRSVAAGSRATTEPLGRPCHLAPCDRIQRDFFASPQNGGLQPARSSCQAWRITGQGGAAGYRESLLDRLIGGGGERTILRLQFFVILRLRRIDHGYTCRGYIGIVLVGSQNIGLRLEHAIADHISNLPGRALLRITDNLCQAKQQCQQDDRVSDAP